MTVGRPTRTTEGATSIPPQPLLLCLSHLRWDFVFQRPQHLLSRAARTYRVLFVEEPWRLPPSDDLPRLQRRVTEEGVEVVIPMIAETLDEVASEEAQRALLDELLEGRQPDVLWFYTPMAFAFASHLKPRVTVYDCMDELSAFRGASPRMTFLERRMMGEADLVFTGGRSLYEAKRDLHPAAHQFTSGVDVAHFSQARVGMSDPADQASIPRPRLGWFGVVDERMDLGLVDEAAAMRPDWQFVMVGPVVKIEESSLPRRPNIHWIGPKKMAELPAYLAGWDVGFMPFAMNEHTRYISPTKTPEYLAAGVPVVSTPITDVVRDWGDEGYVAIARDAGEVVAAAEGFMAEPRGSWWPDADARLAKCSWDSIWAAMDALIRGVAAKADGASSPPSNAVAGPNHV